MLSIILPKMHPNKGNGKAAPSLATGQKTAEIKTTGTRTPSSASTKPEKVTYTKLKEFGCRGGLVELKQENPSGKLFAFKTMRAEDEMRYPILKDGKVIPDEEEAKFMDRYLRNSPVNIAKLYDVSTNYKEGCVMRLEYCSGGDLDRWINHWKKKKIPVPPIFVAHVLASLIDALAYMHYGRHPMRPDGSYDPRSRHEGLVHCDIKTGNVFLRWPSNVRSHSLPDIVLGDFGLSTTKSRSWSLSGTPGYVAPEVLKAKALYFPPLGPMNPNGHIIIDRKSDVYSMGVTVARLIGWGKGNDPPTAGMEEMVGTWRLPQGFPDIAQKIKDCLNEDPDKRPHTEDLWRFSGEIKKHLEPLISHTDYRMPSDSYKENEYAPR